MQLIQPSIFRFFSRITTLLSFILGSMYIVSAQTTSKNYVRTQTLMIAESDTSNLSSLSSEENHTTITYTDDLGRPIQTVLKQISPLGNDLVTTTQYDPYGREPRKHLPFTKPNNNGTYTPSIQAIQEGTQFHRTLHNVEPNHFPYRDKIYQMRPGKRVLEQGSPGSEWQLGNGHTTTSSIQTNTTSDDVWLFTIVNNDAIKTGTYPLKTLTKRKITDPNGHTTTTYSNQKGQTILQRSQTTITIDSDTGPPTSTHQTLNTYYLYDHYGLLRYILPPQAIEEIKNNNLTQVSALTQDWIYKTTYDRYKRPIEKTIPGAGTTYYIYNTSNQIIATQTEENQRLQQWQVTKYDSRGNITYTALYNNADSRSIFQTNADQHTFLGRKPYEETTPPNTPSTFFMGYTNQSFPLLNSTSEITAVYHYDDYDYDNDGIKDADYESDPSQEIHTEVNLNTLGLLTGTHERVHNQPGSNGISCAVDWITTTPFYDPKGRLIYTHTNNALGGTDQTWNQYDFIGNLTKTKTIHTSPTDQFSHYDEYHYEQNRLIDHYHRNGKGQTLKIENNQYNEVGHLTEKKLHQTPNGNYLQTFVNNYDKKGRLISINNCRLKKDKKEITNDTLTLTHVKTYLTYTPSSGKLYQTNKLTYRPAGTKEDQCNEQTHTETQFIGNENHFTPETYQALQAQSNTTIDLDLDITIDPSRPYNPTWRKLHHTITNQFHALGFNNPQATEKMAETITNSVNTLTPKSTQNDTNALFGMTITYTDNQPLGGTYTNYNNNPIATCWKHKGQPSQTYELHYDDQGRLTSAPYAALNPTTKTWTDKIDHFTLSKVSYDLHGNITHLKRKAEGVVNNGPVSGTVDIDDLHYTYEGNRLTQVKDNATHRAKYDFHDGDTANDEYKYNHNGYLIQDKNKGITNIIYDHNNLPIEITMTTGTIKTLRTSTGTKLKEEIYYNTGGITNTQPDKTTVYTSSVVYKTQGNDPIDQWSYVTTPYGRIVKSLSSNTRATASYRNEYRIADQLDNTRVMFSDINNDGTIDPSEVLQRNDYRPFGMPFESSQSPVLTDQDNHFLYNNKEFQDELDLNWSDYGARQYDASLGRWMGIDPMAEKYASLSTYNYVFNSPMQYIDPDGMEPTDPRRQKIIEATMNELGRKKTGSYAVKIPGTNAQLNVGKMMENETTLASLTNGISEANGGTLLVGGGGINNLGKLAGNVGKLAGALFGGAAAGYALNESGNGINGDGINNFLAAAGGTLTTMINAATEGEEGESDEEKLTELGIAKELVDEALEDLTKLKELEEEAQEAVGKTFLGTALELEKEAMDALRETQKKATEAKKKAVEAFKEKYGTLPPLF